VNRDRRNFLIALGAAGAVGAGLGAFAAIPRELEPTPSATKSVGNSRRIRAATLAQQFGDAAATPVWSPTGDALCVQHARAGERMIAVYDASSWTMRFSAIGSLPAWAPDGMELAVIVPFPPSIPPTDPTTVRVLDSRTGAEKRYLSAQTASVGWSAHGLRATVGGDLVSLDPALGPSAGSCGGACEIGIWSALAEYALTADRSQPSNYTVRDGTSGKVLASLGNARGLSAWASASPTLVGSFGQASISWHPNGGAKVLALPDGYQPIVAAPDGDLVLCSRMTSGRLEWLQHASGIGKSDEVDLPIPSTRGVTWDPSGRYVTTIPASFGLSAQLQVFQLDVEP
jgi:hypothetical protein